MRLVVLSHGSVSLISPEACAAILWKSSQAAPKVNDYFCLTGCHFIIVGIVPNVNHIYIHQHIT